MYAYKHLGHVMHAQCTQQSAPRYSMVFCNRDHLQNNKSIAQQIIADIILLMDIYYIWEDLVVCVCVCVCVPNGRPNGLPDLDQNLGMDSHLPWG